MDKMNFGVFFSFESFCFCLFVFIVFLWGVCVDSRDRIRIFILEVEEERFKESKGFVRI